VFVLRTNHGLPTIGSEELSPTGDSLNESFGYDTESSCGSFGRECRDIDDEDPDDDVSEFDDANDKDGARENDDEVDVGPNENVGEDGDRGAD